MAPYPPKPIKLWITPPGPNPWKAVWILEELGLNYELEVFKFDDVKKAPFININPNGRVPAIQDPNEDLTLWESGAIYQYVAEVYDNEHKLSYATLKERHLCNQWLHFQMSGQGPYFGQLSWFKHLHGETVDSAIERYDEEVKRILGVLETALSAKPADAQWLVGDKMTFADMAFLPWNFRLSEVTGRDWDKVWEGLPHVRAWHNKMAEMDSWKRCMEIREKYMKAQALQWNGFPEGIETFTEYVDKIATGGEEPEAKQ